MLTILFVLVGLVTLQLYFRMRPVRKDEFLLGTYIRITAYGPLAERAIEQAIAEMAKVEKYTATDTGPVALINKKAGEEPVKVNKELFSLLQNVLAFSRVTDGLFNPAIGPLVDMWGFGYNQTGRIPRTEEITSALSLINRELIILNEKEQTVYLTKKGMRIDLGGVAKGYAVDRAWEVLADSQVWGALINGGESSIRVLGTRPNFKPWRIGIVHPRQEEWIGVIELSPGKAIGTSADTQRYFESEGRRYSHLINPYAGYPPDDIYSATVITESAFEADIYSTAAFVAEGADRIELLNKWRLEGVITDSKGQTHYTQGIEKILK